MYTVFRILFAVAALLVLLVACQHVRHSDSAALPPRPEGALRLATWNVHYILLIRPQGRWGLSGWEERKDPMDRTFRALDADIVAFQEMESFSRGSDGSVNLARDWLLGNNAGYAAAASGDWRSFPSTQPIFYRAARFDLLDQGWFFFSDTPDVIYSRTFDGGYPAFASWARFEDRGSGAVFRVINVHFDASSRENRQRSADLVAREVAPWIDAGEAVLLLGDLNALHGSRLHRTLEATGVRFPRVPGATYHLDRGLHLFGAIDHVGLSDGIEELGDPMVVRDRNGGVWASDHYPVVMDLGVAPRDTMQGALR